MPDKKMYSNIVKWVRAEIQKISADAQVLLKDYLDKARDADDVIKRLAENAISLNRDFDMILAVTGAKEERNDAE